MARRKHIDVPTTDNLLKPVIEALIQLGGSGTIEEINEKVYSLLELGTQTLQIQHGADGRSEIEYRLAWARTHLKAAGIITNSARKVWALVRTNTRASELNSAEITKLARQKTGERNSSALPADAEVPIIEEVIDEAPNWQERLLIILLNIPPDAFERLTQRLLRESGFVQVEVTGKTNDGGIDGKGIVRISGFLSFHVIFQCKRYKGSISSGQIRDFRGAMQGRADKGLFITTGTFSREATKEATRDGAPPIDLIDGELLCEKLKEFKLGVQTELVEIVELHPAWFTNL
ncbi:restriction endonuclease [Hymenobacter psoromatis]|uniref:restriction endonuclease n=1 Tax=Hymenobacter psoromatis TaxID=1484116 RepID=UPI001CBBE559|nr:restriction endonuclease [Hymenobacter psoromatis]